MHTSNFRYFSDTDVSQGSSATCLRCGGIVNGDFDAYLLVNVSVKNFANWSTFAEVMDNIIVGFFESPHSVTPTTLSQIHHKFSAGCYLISFQFTHAF